MTKRIGFNVFLGLFLFLSFCFFHRPAYAEPVPILQWETNIESLGGRLNAFELTFDPEGNFYVVGNGGSYYIGGCQHSILKYSPAGSLLLRIDDSINHCNEPDCGPSFGMDQNGNFYNFWVTDWILNSGKYSYTSVYEAVSWDSDGVERWSVDFSGLGSFDPTDKNMVIDSEGNVYVVAEELYSTHDGVNAIVKKYSSMGDEQWTKTFPMGFWGKTNKLSIDDSGYLYLLVYLSSIPGYELIKFDTDGKLLWEHPFPRVVECYMGMIDVRGNGNSVFVGPRHFDGESTWNIAKLDPDGTQLWELDYPVGAYTEWFSGGLHHMTVGEDETIYLTGARNNMENPDKTSKSGIPYTTVALNPDGSVKWSVIGNNGDGEGYIVKTDSKGNVYVYLKESCSSYKLVKYDSAGSVLWELPIENGSINGSRNTIAIDADENVYFSLPMNLYPNPSENRTAKYCAGCIIDSVCMPGLSVHSENPCLVCDPENSQTAWTELTGPTCDDGIYCNGYDACEQGICSVHSGDPCIDNGLFCDGEEYCDEAAGACLQSGDPCDGANERCEEDTDSCEIYVTGSVSKGGKAEGGNDDDTSESEDDYENDDDESESNGEKIKKATSDSEPGCGGLV